MRGRIDKRLFSLDLAVDIRDDRVGVRHACALSAFQSSYSGTVAGCSVEIMKRVAQSASGVAFVVVFVAVPRMTVT